MDSRQLLGIDAHNYHPDAPAMFGAMYSRDLPGHGPLYLDWVALNQDRGMVGLAAIANVDFNDDLEGVWICMKIWFLKSSQVHFGCPLPINDANRSTKSD